MTTSTIVDLVVGCDRASQADRAFVIAMVLGLDAPAIEWRRGLLHRTFSLLSGTRTKDLYYV